MADDCERRNADLWALFTNQRSLMYNVFMSSTTAKHHARAAQWFHALSDETRLRIIEQVSKGEQCVCDLTDSLRAGQSRLSFHLKTLKDAGLLKDRRDGRWIYYSLNPDSIEELHSFVTVFKEDSRRAGVATKCCD